MKLHITERALSQMKVEAGKKKEVFLDTELTGFGVCMTAKGTKTYCVIYRDAEGTQRQASVGPVRKMPLAQARLIAEQKLAELAQEKRKKQALAHVFCPTMDDFFHKSFLPLVKSTSRSYKTHISIYRTHLQPVFADRRLDAITEEDVVAFHSMLKAKKSMVVKAGADSDTLADSTVKRTLILFRHIMNEAIRDKRVPLTENVTKVLRLSTVRKVKGQFLGKPQLRSLLQAAKQSDNTDLADIVRVMGATGLRRSNVLEMRWSWFNSELGTLDIPAEEDKAGQGFKLYLSDELVQFLEQKRLHADGSPWVFTNPQTGKPYRSCKAAWAMLIRRAKLPGLRMHDLRHTYASMMLDSGSDIVDVQRALGHTQLKTTAVYLHSREGRKRECAARAVRATGLFS